METITYGHDDDQVADLHLPGNADPPWPVVVLIHGGFWRAQYRRDLMAPLAGDLAVRGYAVWNIEYRRVAAGGGWPTTLDDAAAAIDHLTVLDQPLDLARVAAVGHSAGGQLAIWAAARRGLPPGAPGADPQVVPRAAVVQAGLLDLVAAAQEGLGSDATQAFIGGGPDQVPDRYRLASPVARVPIETPVVLVHGEDDHIVPSSQSRRYAEAAVSAGDRVDLIELAGAGHLDVIDPDRNAWQVVLDRLPELLGTDRNT